MNNKENCLYFKVGTNVVSVPEEDFVNHVVNCANVKVLMWTKQEPFYKFEHNDLAQHIAETENMECLEGLQTPDSLIDYEIIDVLKKMAEKKPKPGVHVDINNYISATNSQRGFAFVALKGNSRRAFQKRSTSSNYKKSVNRSLRTGKKSDKTMAGKTIVAIK